MTFTQLLPTVSQLSPHQDKLRPIDFPNLMLNLRKIWAN
jgi:hypothetical protein